MIALCAEAGLKPPEFRQDAGSFIQTLWRPVQAGAVAGQVTAQVGTQLGLSRDQEQVLRQVVVEQNVSVLMRLVGRSNRSKFRDQVLNPLITAGLIEMTIPDKPTSSLQKYRTTEKGRTLLAKRKP